MFGSLVCINRNILECKDNQMVDMKLKAACSINRNILECKDCSNSVIVCGNSVLIETYWNVKWYFCSP